MIYQLQLVSLSMTFNEPYLKFKVTTLVVVEYLRNSARQKHSYNENTNRNLHTAYSTV